MAINANEDTEFNDALRKHGILPPLPPPPRSPSPPPKKTLAEEAEELTADELRQLTEDADEETERILEHVKRTRLREEKRERELGRFGRVYPIGRDDYTREVTEASIVGDDAAIRSTTADEDDDLAGSDFEDGAASGSRASGNGTGVVCFLYKDGIPASDRTFQQIHILAARHPRTKFVSIVGDKCIPNLPDGRIPMIIVYRKGDIKQQIVGWARDKERRIEELEAFLIASGAIIPSSIPQSSKSERNSDSEEDLSGDDDPSSRMRSSATSTNRKAPKNIRGKQDDGSDSDFDL